MLKQKPYDWRETNLEFIGSDWHKKANLDSAENERAWDGCGEKAELRVWRIEQFKIVAWPKEKYGKFHTGDSYIVYHSRKQSEDTEKLLFDIYFWIGSESTQDEYGTAAYKTVELDSKLNDAAIQHRETQYHESDEFKALFNDLEYLPEGVKTGFNHVGEDEPQAPELFRIKGLKNKLAVKKMKLRKDSLNTHDVYVLDRWDKLFQWNGKQSNRDEVVAAETFLKSVAIFRDGVKMETVEEGQESVEFLNELPDKWEVGCMTVQTYNVGMEEKVKDEDVKVFRSQLLKLANQAGNPHFEKVGKAEKSKENKIAKQILDSSSVFLLDDGLVLWVWTGKDASSKDNGAAFVHALKYTKDFNRPSYLPVRRVREGQEPEVFHERFHNGPVPSSCVTV